MRSCPPHKPQLLFFIRGRSPRSTLFPYTTLFRSRLARPGRRQSLPVGAALCGGWRRRRAAAGDRKSTRLNSSHTVNSYAVFCLKKNNTKRGQIFSTALYAATATRSAAFTIITAHGYVLVGRDAATVAVRWAAGHAKLPSP